MIYDGVLILYLYYTHIVLIRKQHKFQPIGSMVLYMIIYGNMDPINIPQMLAYIPAPWILWVKENVTIL